jgi:hypothetical protein
MRKFRFQFLEAFEVIMADVHLDAIAVTGHANVG